MDLAETLLGPRDKGKKIYPPRFADGGPRLQNTSSLDGALIELSKNAGAYWPTAVFEMAHETVHLLNPTVGYTNWLEEGTAVAFSLRALEHFSLPAQPITLKSYQEALSLVRLLPGAPFEVARKLRAMAGALNVVTHEQLLVVAPQHPLDQVRRLSSECVPR